jgi:hypothetical protein
MPFPTTVHVTRIIRTPDGAGDNVVERVAEALRRSGLPGVSTGQSVVRFDSAESTQQAATVATSGEIEIVDRGHEVELIAEAEVGRIPLAFGTATLLSATLVGGPRVISVGGGLIAGGLIALVPWWIARLRLSAVLKRVALLAEDRRAP